MGVLVVPGAFADDFFSPPQLEPQAPPWIQEAQKQQEAQDQAQPNGAPQDSGPPPGFWGEEEEELPPRRTFTPSNRSSNNDKPKNSFQLTEPWNDVLGDDEERLSCLGWGHPFLGITMYQKEDGCAFILSQKIEQSKQDVRSLEDHTRRLILKKVIQGDIKREESKTYDFRYDLLTSVLQEAKIQGCKCLQ